MTDFNAMNDALVSCDADKLTGRAGQKRDRCKGKRGGQRRGKERTEEVRQGAVDRFGPANECGFFGDLLCIGRCNRNLGRRRVTLILRPGRMCHSHAGHGGKGGPEQAESRFLRCRGHGKGLVKKDRIPARIDRISGRVVWILSQDDFFALISQAS